MKLADLKQTLQANSIRPSQRLGQNFLHNTHYLQRIAELAEVGREDRAVEIGPGTGALTDVLLGLEAKVLAIEKDRRLAAYLRSRYEGLPNLELIQGDGLDYARNSNYQWQRAKLVSNLPYSVASPILVELAAKPNPPELMVVTIQLEVANRIRAKAGESDFGLLSLLLQSRFEIGDSFKIPAGCFYPVPEVESACIRLNRRAKPILDSAELEVFDQIARRGFSQRRKMMSNLLKKDWSSKVVDEGFAQLGLSLQVRAEAVSIEQFVELARFLVRTRRGGKVPVEPTRL